MIKRLVLLLSLVVLVSCAGTSEKSVVEFDLESRQFLYDLESWFFSGRMALSNQHDSVTVSLQWQHNADRDELELSGPLGQGASRISVWANSVKIESADQNAIYQGDVDQFFSARLGFDVPMTALKYWVLGLVDPAASYQQTVDGFIQYGWKVVYKSVQQTQNVQLPGKMTVFKDDAKLKLVISDWKIKI